MTANEACDMGYNNYKCNEIKDGTVILKHTDKKKADDDEDPEGKDYQGWYDSVKVVTLIYTKFLII